MQDSTFKNRAALKLNGITGIVGKLGGGGALLAAALTLGGCGAAGEPDPGDIAQEPSALCTTCAPTAVTPPTPTAWTTVPTNGEVGNGASLTSAASPTGSFVGGFQGLIGLPNQVVSIEQTNPPTNTDVCSRTGISATVYAHSKSLGYWYKFGTMGRGGSWVPASGFIGAHCDTTTGLAVKSSDIDQLIVDGYSTFCWYGTCYYRQVTQSVYWYF